MENRAQKIINAVYRYPYWSRAELRKIEDIVDEILDHCANG